MVWDAQRSNLSTAFLVFVYLLGAAFAVGIPAAFLAKIKESSGWPPDWPPDGGVLISAFISLVTVVTVVWGVAGLTRLWLRDQRYGATVCRLITLPGVIGGWFKADIDCRLPPGTGSVTARLKNQFIRPGLPGQTANLLWHMEETTATVAHPESARRPIVPVRLRVLRHYNQRSSVFPVPLEGGPC